MSTPVLFRGRLDAEQRPHVTRNGRRFGTYRHVRDHSQEFAWGYAGSGPAQLALAILCSVLKDEDEAERLHQAFKSLVIARLPEGVPWTLTEAQVLDAVEQLRAARPT